MDKNKKGGAMNDFDFEELDKAVSSLAAKTKSENNLPVSGTPSSVTVTPAARRASPGVSPSEPSVPVASTPPSPRDDALSVSVSAQQPGPTPEVQHAKRLSTTPPKRRGAFMDIVAPSKSSARRTGTTLQPLNPPAIAKSEVAEPKLPAEPVATEAPMPLDEPEKTPNKAPAEAAQLEDRAPEIMADKIQAPEPELKTTPQDTEKPAKAAEEEPSWPDPLDFQEMSEPTPHKEPEGKPASTSPFLPEAKVEKRPLGAFSSFAAKPADDHHQSAMPADAPDLKSDDELTPELNGTFTEPETSKVPTMHDAPKEKKVSKDTPKAADSAKPDMQAQAMMSIPKQYHTKEKTADTAKRPIFDTKEYHPPLLEATAHEHRGGSSMWSKLFIALATLVLLGVAGYFAYLYFVQQ